MISKESMTENLIEMLIAEYIVDGEFTDESHGYAKAMSDIFDMTIIEVYRLAKKEAMKRIKENGIVKA